MKRPLPPQATIPMTTPLTRRLALSMVVLAACTSVVVWTLPACSDKKPRAAVPASTVPVRTYTVRGLIETLPIKDKPSTQLIIRHEDINDFQSQDGRVGMKAMAMPFPLGEGVTLPPLSPGDSVRFDFTVDWNATPSYWITRIEKIDAR